MIGGALHNMIDAAGRDGNIVLQTIVNSPAKDMPPSFNGDSTLFWINLALMTGSFMVGLMLFFRQIARIYIQRKYDKAFHPVTIYRVTILLAALGFVIGAGADAYNLWSWTTGDVGRIADATILKRYLDPIRVLIVMTWMAIHITSEPGIEVQLRRLPLPLNPWSRWPVLMRALLVLGICFTAAGAAAWFR